MSYQKVKSITRRPKDGKIFITSACNNLYPITYSRWEFRPENTDYNDKLMHLINSIDCGTLQLNDSMHDWRYALIKTKEEMVKRHGDSYDLYDLTSMNCQEYCLGGKTGNGIITITESDLKNGNYVFQYKLCGKEIYFKEEEYTKKKEQKKESLAEYCSVFLKYLEEKINGKYYLYDRNCGCIKYNEKSGTIYYGMDYIDKKDMLDYKKAYCIAYKINIKKVFNIEIKQFS